MRSWRLQLRKALRRPPGWGVSGEHLSSSAQRYIWLPRTSCLFFPWALGIPEPGVPHSKYGDHAGPFPLSGSSPLREELVRGASKREDTAPNVMEVLLPAHLEVTRSYTCGHTPRVGRTGSQGGQTAPGGLAGLRRSCPQNYHLTTPSARFHRWRHPAFLSHRPLP